MKVRKQQLELDMGQQTGSKQEKEYVKAVYCHPAYLTYAEYIMRNAELEEAQAGIKSKMKPFPATVSQEKSHVRYWRSKRYLAPLMRPTKCPDIPVSLKRNTEVFPHHFL